MRLLADESVDRQIVDALRADGHLVLSVAEMEPGIADDVALSRGNEAEALLVTADTDFGELVFRQKLVSRGVVLVRLAGLPPEVKARITAGAVRQHEAQLPGAFTVIAPTIIRIRTPR